MAGDENAEITAALTELAAEDPAAARDAEAAVKWIAGEDGLALVTQERIQNFVWYELPLKWRIDLGGKVAVAEALARALDLLGLPRYAAICRSETTRAILSSYAASTAAGRLAFRRASAASGIQPRDLPEFEWGATMGLQEASAMSSAADFLELAVAGGDLVPGARGWKTRQQELVRTHLNTPREELVGQTLAQLILTERAETWVNLRRSEVRRGILAAIANRLLHPPELPADAAADPLPPLRWLLEQVAGGIALTETGNLNQKFVQAAADRFRWDFPRPPRTEDDLFDLHQLRHLLQRLGLARRSGRRLVLTAKGRRLAADSDQLWRAAARGLLNGNDFSVFAGELFLALLLDTDSMPYDKIKAVVGRAAGEEGFRERRTGEPPKDSEVDWAIHDTINLCRALEVLSVGAGWTDRSYGLTETGKATALEALRARATGPRTIPWP
ncbi:MAG TPA: hypothetical protein VMK13_11230 [Streptosporangiaceae bacterium]|nr:hypothetical protein [Streptosporangiaceae bacterium]